MNIVDTTVNNLYEKEREDQLGLGLLRKAASLTFYNEPELKMARQTSKMNSKRGVRYLDK